MSRIHTLFARPCAVPFDRTAHVCISNVTTSPATSLASQPYFSACACALGRGEGGGRKSTSGDYSTVFVSNGNVISAFCHAIIA